MPGVVSGVSLAQDNPAACRQRLAVLPLFCRNTTSNLTSWAEKGLAMWRRTVRSLLRCIMKKQSEKLDVVVCALTILSAEYGDDESDFYVTASCEIKERGAAGGDTFDIQIVSPQRLTQFLHAGEPEWGNGYIISRVFDKQKTIVTMQAIIDDLACSSWDELCHELSKHFHLV